MYKVAKIAVCDHLIDYLNTREFPLYPIQFGFRSYHSTDTANFFFVEQIEANLDQGGVVGAIILDFKKGI